MEWFKNLSKDSQKLFVGVIIFVSGFLTLALGGSISSEELLGISIPMILMGVTGCITGFFCLITCLTTWWDRR